MVPPGAGPGNYTLDYNECFFNFCECCPPERGPPGPVGEKGLAGKKTSGNCLVGSYLYQMLNETKHTLFVIL